MGGGKNFNGFPRETDCNAGWFWLKIIQLWSPLSYICGMFLGYYLNTIWVAFLGVKFTIGGYHFNEFEQRKKIEMESVLSSAENCKWYPFHDANRFWRFGSKQGQEDLEVSWRGFCEIFTDLKKMLLVCSKWLHLLQKFSKTPWLVWSAHGIG